MDLDPILAEFIVHLLYLILLPKNSNDKKKNYLSLALKRIHGYYRNPWEEKEPISSRGIPKLLTK